MLVAGKAIAVKALEEIDNDNLMQVSEFKGRERRAAVFYVDQGQRPMENVIWWIHAWRFIGLNDAEEAFDLVMMVHPLAIENLPKECREITEDFLPNFGEEGECLYKPYIGKINRQVGAGLCQAQGKLKLIGFGGFGLICFVC